MDKPSVLAVDPKPGDIVIFKYRGGWTRGYIVGEGTKLRLPVRRDDIAVHRRIRRIYWRNRTQIFHA